MLALPDTGMIDTRGDVHRRSYFYIPGMMPDRVGSTA